MAETENIKETKKEVFLTIHGHFYQPPRENPWLEAIELQDSAKPFHDWNERINKECYNPNSVSKVVDSRNRILDVVDNRRGVRPCGLEHHGRDTLVAVHPVLETIIQTTQFNVGDIA